MTDEMGDEVRDVATAVALVRERIAAAAARAGAIPRR